jgi:hypothetical protein
MNTTIKIQRRDNRMCITFARLLSCELPTRGAQCSPYLPIILINAPRRNRTRDSACAVYDDVARRLVRRCLTMRLDMHLSTEERQDNDSGGITCCSMYSFLLGGGIC